MKLEAVIHPSSISRYDPKFDPDIHIAVEDLASSAFRSKMIGLPVTAYHHDTMRAVSLLYERKLALTAQNMRAVLIELHKTMPTPQQLGNKLLQSKGLPANQENLWRVLPLVSKDAGGPGVLGEVTQFWRQGDKWLVAMELNNVSAFQKKLIKKGGALGEVSLTHAVIGNIIEPLEISFTIQGLRTGSTINRIVSASANHPHVKSRKMSDVVVEDPACPIRSLYDKLEPENKSLFMAALQSVKQASVGSRNINESRLAELEKSIDTIQTSVANALQELGPNYFGNIRQRTADEWKTDPASLVTANEFILAAAVNNMHKRKRDNDELDKALEDISGGNRIVAASTRQKTAAAPADDEFFKELRLMRATLKNMP